jgi:hypothetical protein
MNKADSIIEVTIHHFFKGEKELGEYLEAELFSLGGKSWDEVTDEIPEAERGPTHNGLGQELNEKRPDCLFKEDWIAFSFVTVAEGTADWPNCVEYEVNEIGWEEALRECRDELLALAPKLEDPKKGNIVKILTAWRFVTVGGKSSSWYCSDDDFDCYLELVGRLEMSNINLLTAARVKELNNQKPAVEPQGDLLQ